MDEGSKQEIERSVQEANMDGMQNIQVINLFLFLEQKIYGLKFFYFRSKIVTFDLQAQYEQDIRIAEMQAEMVEFDNKIFELVCEKDELETRLKFAEISAILLYEEFQVVNQDQVNTGYTEPLIEQTCQFLAHGIQTFATKCAVFQSFAKKALNLISQIYSQCPNSSFIEAGS